MDGLTSRAGGHCSIAPWPQHVRCGSSAHRILSAHNGLRRRAMLDHAAGLQLSAASVRRLLGKESFIQRDFELSRAAELQQCSPDASEGVGHFGCELDDCAIAVGRLAILTEGLARPRETKPRLIELRPDRRQGLEQPLRLDVVLPSCEQLAEAMNCVRVSWLDIQDQPIAPLSFGESPVSLEFGCLSQGVGNSSPVKLAAEVEPVLCSDSDASDPSLLYAKRVFVGFVAAREIIFLETIGNGITNAVCMQHHSGWRSLEALVTAREQEQKCRHAPID